MTNYTYGIMYAAIPVLFKLFIRILFSNHNKPSEIPILLLPEKFETKF